MIITRKEYERKISEILKNVNTLQGLKVCLSNADRQIACFQKSRNNTFDQKRKHELRKEMKFWYFFRNRIYVTSEMWIDDALEDQQFHLIPEHERTTTGRYRYLASFRLVPSELRFIKGFDKLVKFGWYNHISNPNGVVKDHRISVKFGYDNKIDPAILGHPANCEFLTVAENARKSCDCSLSMLELQLKIRTWRL